ncbi:hypothetical protein SPB21_08605 [Leptothoe sp. ISB3NOV94-8A]
MAESTPPTGWQKEQKKKKRQARIVHIPREIQQSFGPLEVQTSSGTAQSIDSNSPKYEQVKYKEFFKDNQWHKKLAEVTVSSDGSKGVFFVKTTVRTSKKLQRVYVIKPTNAPQQILFAEWMLKEFAQVKIPESFAIPLQNSTLTTKGINPIDFLSSAIYFKTYINNKITDQLNNNNNLTDQEKERYKQSLNNLNSSNYIIVMKRMDGVIISGFDKGLQRCLKKIYMKSWFSTTKGKEYWSKNVEKFRTDPAFPDKLFTDDEVFTRIVTIDSEPAYVVKQVRQLKLDNITAQLKSNKELKEAINLVNEIKNILKSKQAMYQLGRILAVDCLLGNGDRLAPINLGNLIFIEDSKNKGEYKVGVIDNDAFFPIYMWSGEQHERIRDRFPDLKNSLDQYLKYLFEDGGEISEEKPAPGMGIVTIPFPKLKFLLSNFSENWFVRQFCVRLFNNRHIDLIWEIWNRDEIEAIKKTAQSCIVRGFKDVIVDIKDLSKSQLCFNSFKDLKNTYEYTINFDVVALRARIEYMSNISFTNQDMTTFTFNSTEALKKVKENLFKGEVNSHIKNAINFCQQNEVISLGLSQELMRLVTGIPTKDQLNFLELKVLPPKSKFGSIKKFVKQPDTKPEVLVDIDSLDSECMGIINLIICAELMIFRKYLHSSKKASQANTQNADSAWVYVEYLKNVVSKNMRFEGKKQKSIIIFKGKNPGKSKKNLIQYIEDNSDLKISRLFSDN